MTPCNKNENEQNKEFLHGGGGNKKKYLFFEIKKKYQKNFVKITKKY